MQAIYSIPEICARKGIQHAVISPGSRSAPITISFARNESINKYIIPDERSAAFVALGLSRTTDIPSVLICTSGSAGYNYAPAVAEAFFQQIPLVILTADRPPEWIDQLDGQTIRQTNLYGNHVKESYTLPVSAEHTDALWHSERIINDAINLANRFPKGPVHINVPLREPFYPKGELTIPKEVKIIEEPNTSRVFSESEIQKINKELNAYSSILVVAGQGSANIVLQNQLQKLSVPVVTDVISNMTFEGSIQKHDLYVGLKSFTEDSSLKPALLLSFGNSIISKSLKGYLRKQTKMHHWHIQEAGEVADTFQHLTRIVRVDPLYFFTTFGLMKADQPAFKIKWQQIDEKHAPILSNYIKSDTEFGELAAVDLLLKSIPENSYIHLANSMPVRYANYIGIPSQGVVVVANRGTSGIDGTISTAVGNALASDKLVFVLTGDMSFLYDRNAFWNNHLPSNLRILVLNNHGGGIFRMIDGPSSQPEGEAYFVTEQRLTAENTLKDFDIEYTKVSNAEQFKQLLPAFISKEGKSKVLEFESDGNLNTTIWKRFKEILK